MKRIYMYMTMLLMAICMFFACSNDDHGGGQPVITGVRLTDPAKADSTFTQAARGTMLLVMGQNIGDVKEAYINGQVCSFNSTLNTSTHLIITIPADLEIIGVEEREIQLVTDHGIAVYAFRVVGPEPGLYYYRSETKGAITPGTTITLIGANFYDVESIYICEDEEGIGTHYPLTEFTVGDKLDVITVVMPQSFPEAGYLFVKCIQGTSAPIEFSVLPIPPAITGVSSDMPIVGEKVIIYGHSFIDVTGVQFGDVFIEADDLTINSDENEISFIMHAVPAQTDGTLTVISENGNATCDFYDYLMIISDFDNYSPGGFSWGGCHYTEEDGPNAPEHRSGHIHGIEGTSNPRSWGWGTMFFGGFTLPTVISSDTPIEDVELRFNYYLGTPTDNIHTIRICLSDDWDKVYGDFFPTDYITQNNEAGHWMTFSCPLAKFTDKGTYGEYASIFTGGFGLCMDNTTENPGTEIVFYIDNIRLYVNETKTEEK